MEKGCLYCYYLTQCTLLCLICRSVFRRLQAASGLYGMVAVPDKTMLLHPVVGRFTTGAIVRVVQPAEVLRTLPWTLEDNKSCGRDLRLTFNGEGLWVPLLFEYVGPRLFIAMNCYLLKHILYTEVTNTYCT